MSERGRTDVTPWSNWPMARQDPDRTYGMDASHAHAGDIESRSGDAANISNAEACYEEYGELLFRFLVHGFRRQLSIEDAEDVVQETFIELVKNLQGGHEEIAHPKSWLFEVARRKMLDRITRRHRRARLLPLYTALSTSLRTSLRSNGSSQGAVEGRVIEQERLEVVTDALTRMTPFERECFYLRAHGGLSLQEIADIVGVDRKRVFDGIQRAAHKIQRLSDDGVPRDRRRGVGPLMRIAKKILSHRRGSGAGHDL